MPENNKAEKLQVTHTTVTICIITYQRTKELLRLINSLRDLSFNKSPQPELQIVIVENDPAGTLKPLINEAQDNFPVRITYAVEPTRGIASARNTAVKLAPVSDFIAFIDDDEIADTYWLDELLAVQKETNADIVSGPVLPLFEKPPPPWVIKGGFFNRPKRETGIEIRAASTNNMLVRKKILDTIEGPFDTKFNFSGGSDSLLSQTIKQRGGKLVWAEQAQVSEYNPPERTQVSWILQRAFRIGMTASLVEKKILPVSRMWLVRLLKGLTHIIIGVFIMTPQVLCLGYAGIIKSLHKLALGSGQLFALFGGKYEEYANRKIRKINHILK